MSFRRAGPAGAQSEASAGTLREGTGTTRSSGRPPEAINRIAAVPNSQPARQWIGGVADRSRRGGYQKVSSSRTFPYQPEDGGDDLSDSALKGHRQELGIPQPNTSSAATLRRFELAARSPAAGITGIQCHVFERFHTSQNHTACQRGHGSGVESNAFSWVARLARAVSPGWINRPEMWSEGFGGFAARNRCKK